MLIKDDIIGYYAALAKTVCIYVDFRYKIARQSYGSLGSASLNGFETQNACTGLDRM